MAWLVSLKVLMISCTTVVLLALVMKLSVPSYFNLSLFYQLPSIWSTFLSWLKPPYLYFIVNGIIIVITVCSRFHHDHPQPVEFDAPTKSKVPEHRAYETKIIYYPAYHVLHQPRVYKHRVQESIFEDLKPIVVNGSPDAKSEPEPEYNDDDVMISASTCTPPAKKKQSREIFLPAEKLPLVSSELRHRQSVKTNPGGGARVLTDTKRRRHETLDNTWKMITEGQSKSLSRHIKNCDTWENHDRQIDLDHVEVESLRPIMKKSETFKDRTDYIKIPYVTTNEKIKKESSLSRDELNRRVEAFINKFNKEMWLQRQQSLQQYMEMIK